MALQLIAPPQVEPISVDELKEFLRVDADDNSQDNVIAALGTGARSWCETFTQRRFISQTWRLLMDYFPGYIDSKLSGSKVSSPFISGSNAILVGIRYAIALPYPPVQSISLFQYLNANGTTTVMNPATDYVQDLASNPARLTPPFGQMWPVARVVVNAIQVDFVVGHARPVTVSIAVSANAITGATFTQAQVGQPISIPGAGNGALNTIIASVDGSGNATVRDPSVLAVSNALAVVGQPGAPAGLFEAARTAIRLLVNHWYENRVPNDNDIPMAVKTILWPYRDLRF